MGETKQYISLHLTSDRGYDSKTTLNNLELTYSSSSYFLFDGNFKYSYKKSDGSSVNGGYNIAILADTKNPMNVIYVLIEDIFDTDTNVTIASFVVNRPNTTKNFYGNINDISRVFGGCYVNGLGYTSLASVMQTNTTPNSNYGPATPYCASSTSISNNSRVLKLGLSANGNIAKTFSLSGDKKSDCKSFNVDGDNRTYAIYLQQGDDNNNVYSFALIDLTANRLHNCADLTENNLDNLIPRTFISGSITYNNGDWTIESMSGTSVGNLRNISINPIERTLFRNNLVSSTHYYNYLS